MEQWRELPDWPDYRFSDLGKAQTRKRRGYNAKRGLTGEWKDLKGKPDRGYTLLTLRRGGKAFFVCLHVFVARAFHGEPGPGQEVRHLDGDRSNNRADNLCWGTKVENQADRRLHGTDNDGERHGLAKMTNVKVKALRADRASGMGYADLGRKYGITDVNARNIALRITWDHVD